jgi:hypothetical protein
VGVPDLGDLAQDVQRVRVPHDQLRARVDFWITIPSERLLNKYSSVNTGLYLSESSFNSIEYLKYPYLKIYNLPYRCFPLKFSSETKSPNRHLLLELLGKMWVQRRRFEVSRTSVWLGSNGLMRARPGRSKYFLMAWWSKLKRRACGDFSVTGVGEIFAIW